jgi:hypothetical protein
MHSFDFIVFQPLRFGLLEWVLAIGFERAAHKVFDKLHKIHSESNQQKIQKLNSLHTLKFPIEIRQRVIQIDKWNKNEKCLGYPKPSLHKNIQK